ncbi:unnamed protein product [Rotaria sp. Silwood2]|nr:unnamed protein product [Rotaria sp. Silwood2]CAF2748508.1 unnamed protein product [Rotaria sp. Silwood2]CAF3007916.1 unnamed protein product [Rotaria sp. Silwood2]CAF3163180.1 unnamed protein product [Rotaria sp. Silwood2]CAF3163197.1 unnamed protein product [Rotaria sp. Silwood2]
MTSTSTTVVLNLLVNGGAESGLSNWIQTGIILVTTDSGSEHTGYYPNSGSNCFYGGSGLLGSESSLLQNVNLLIGVKNFSTTQLDSGILSAKVTFYYQNYDQTIGTSDRVQIVLSFKSASNSILANTSTGELICPNRPGWCQASFMYPLPVGSRSIDYIMRFIRSIGISIESYIDDNSLSII